MLSLKRSKDIIANTIPVPYIGQKGPYKKPLLTKNHLTLYA